MKPKICLLYHVHAHHFRDELPRIVADLAVWIESRFVPFVYRFTRFATISDSSRADMRALGISKLPIVTIHSGVSADHVPGMKAAVPTIAYVGRIRRYKQIRKLLDAFALVKADIPDARLVIAGTGDDLSSLDGEIRRRGLCDVELLGRVDDATKVRVMQEAWVFGMPSQIEGWGIVVIEAAACGTPTVAFDVNGLRDCIVPGSTGFLARDDASFAHYLRDLLGDPHVRERMSEAALRWSKRFSWERTAARTLESIRIAQPWRAVFEPIEGRSWGLRSRARRAVSSLGGVTGRLEERPLETARRPT
jgi:glycosyltransferase involved in cell wall biosynthesis